jgi:hypothetical protein
VVSFFPDQTILGERWYQFKLEEVADLDRICIWTPDSESSSASSPHPLKLSTTISTGHVANIFSAKFLPNAGTPTVVSVAGDHEIRLLEIDRLSSSGGERSDLWGHGGPGYVYQSRLVALTPAADKEA